MANKPLSHELMTEALEYYERFGQARLAAEALGIPQPTLEGRLQKARAARDRGELRISKPFAPIELPSDDLDIDDLLEHRKKTFARKSEAKAARKLIPVQVKIGGPIGIAHFGDPHVDDDGCDIVRLESHLKIVNKTEALFAANLGDLQNNWIGRLARLWADQSTSAKQAWRLVQWMIEYVDWLYIIGGNHDAWSGAGDPVQWIMHNHPGAYEYNGVRVNLQFPSSRDVRINARHDFTGHSMWNPAHGPMKAVQGGWRDHVLTCGHLHTSFVGGPLKDPSSGLLSWAIRCAGYKIIDRYANEKGLPDQNAFPAAITVIDPQFADDDVRLVSVFPSVEEGAEFLTYKRKKWARAQR